MDSVPYIGDITNRDTEWNYVEQPKSIEIRTEVYKKNQIEWIDLDENELIHRSIPIFSFAPLEEIEAHFLGCGYSKREVKSLITGLSELPEYANSNRNKKSKRQS